MINPITKKMLEIIDNYASSYIAGECSYEDAVGLAYGEINEYVETDEFHKEMKEYFDKFVDVKKIGEEEIKWSI